MKERASDFFELRQSTHMLAKLFANFPKASLSFLSKEQKNIIVVVIL